MPPFQGLIQMVFRECAVTLSCLPIPYSSSCYSLQEIKPWGGSRILFQGINYQCQQWWNFLCRLHNAFYKRLTTAFGNKPHKNTNCTMAVQGKSLILTFPRFSWSRIIRVYCSLKETLNDFIMIWFYVIGQNNDANMENDGNIWRFINEIEEKTQKKMFLALDITSFDRKDQISLSQLCSWEKWYWLKSLTFLKQAWSLLLPAWGQQWDLMRSWSFL